jgi:magnesium chelatase family protein
VPRPGEITLAHNGVLFLDELAEFSRPALEALRQPLEGGHVEVTRGQRSLRFPARFMLVAACNACPCARLHGECSCNDADRARYHRRLSGPLLDRIDLVCALEAGAPLELVRPGAARPEASAVVRKRVVAARERQRDRLAGTGARCNADMDVRLTRIHARVPPALARILEAGAASGSLTARGHDRVLRIARTIADIDGRERIEESDLDEAIAYRLGARAAVAA